MIFAIDVLQEEATEDIEKMAGIMPSEKPYLKTGVLDTCRQRIPWLLLLMISSTFTGKIITHYEDALGELLVLTAFIPMIMGTGGNSGSQSSVTVIRGLSLEEIEFKDIFKILWKEFGVAILCGLVLAVATFLKVITLDGESAMIGAVVALTMFFTILLAKLVGCVLPLLAKKVGFDPAVMASPFITTIVDALSLVVYFDIASRILKL